MFNSKTPLWMPNGSVRALLALLIVVPVFVISLKSGVVLTGDQVIGLTSLILTAYFVQKAAAAKPNGE
jgi:hypothetical protein